MIIDDTRTFITLSVDNKPNYKTKTNILGKLINIKCGYNTRNKLRWVIIMDDSNQPLLSQTFLKNKKQCELNFLSNLYNLNFYVTLKQKDKSVVIPEDYDYLNWSNDFDMYFVGSTQDLKERLRVNGRSAYVGN